MAKSLKSLVVCFCFIVFATFAFVGCGGYTPFVDNPKASDVVTGNGSLAVTKGEYVYFVNGYTSYESVEKTNDEGKITYSGLYRIKLTDGHPVDVDVEYDDDGNEIFDGSNSLKNIELLMGKVVGFEYMGLYIFDDYIYYASPSVEVDSNLTVLSSQIDFYRIKLNRGGSSEIIYTTKSAGSSVKYSMMKIDNNVYMSILDGSELVEIKYSSNNKTKTVVCDEVTSVVFPEYTASNQVVTDFNKDIYYTKNSSDESSNGNVVCKFNLPQWKNYESVYSDNNSTITLKQVYRDRLLYENVKASIPSDTTKLYVVENVNEIGGAVAISGTYTNYVFATSGNSTIIASNDSSIVLLNYPNCDNVKLFDGSANIIKVQGDYVYFVDTTNTLIKRVNYIQYAMKVSGEYIGEVSVETLSSTKVKTGQANYVCVNNDKIYYLNTNKTNAYMYMIDLNEVGEETPYYEHFIGVLQTSDYDVEETEDA